VQIGRGQTSVRDGSQQSARDVLFGRVEERQPSTVVVGRCAQRGEQQLSGLKVQIVMALIAHPFRMKGTPPTSWSYSSTS